MRAQKADNPYLLDELTYADVAICALLGAVRPRASARLGPATRRIWTHEVLAQDFSDLLDWRDTVCAKHRPKRAG